jgi:hypothetical protein
MAMAALCALIAVPSYAAYEDSLKGYWKMDDLSADDSFSSGTIDTARWSTSGTAPYVTSGSLQFVSGTTNPGDFSMASSKVNVYGNFDLQVDFNASSMPTPSSGSHLTVFGITVGGYSYVVDNVKLTTGTYIYSSWASKTGATWGNDNTDQSSGKLRITRDGTTLYGYRWTGTAWSQYASITNVGTTPASLYSYTQDYESGGQPASATFDNFTITNGERATDTTNVNPGAIYGATQTTGKTGFGNALNFNGTSDYVQIANESNFDFDRTNAFSAGTWVKTDSSSVQRLLSKMTNASPYTGYEFLIDENGGIVTYLVNDYATGNYIHEKTTQTGFNDDNWHYVSISYDGSSGADGLNIYVDGVEKTTTIYKDSLTGSILNDVSVTLGSRNNQAYYLNGSLDDVAIWSRALDYNEMVMLYDLGTEKFEWLTLGVNDPNELNLGYSTSELKLLADLYAGGNTDATEIIDNLTWHYLSEDLPGDIGGTTYDYGDTWIYDGKYYIKLGSGLEGAGSVPEPTTVAGMILALLLPGAKKTIRRKV